VIASPWRWPRPIFPCPWAPPERARPKPGHQLGGGAGQCRLDFFQALVDSCPTHGISCAPMPISPSYPKARSPVRAGLVVGLVLGVLLVGLGLAIAGAGYLSLGHPAMALGL